MAANEFVLPPVDSSPAQTPPDTTATPLIFVRAFKFTGNTVFTDAELQEFTVPYINGEVTSSDLAELRHKLTSHYIKNGYINSGVIIPKQTITDGVVFFRVIEGRLVDIHITGLKHISTGYVKKRLMSGAGPPLNMKNLQKQVRLLHENPLIRSIKAELKPGNRRGEAVLNAEVDEAVRYRLDAQADNDRSPGVGGNQLTLHAADLNLSGWGDALGIQYGLTQGLREISGYYDLPLTSRDLILNLKYKNNSAHVVEKPFDELDILSDSEDYSIGISRPFIRKSDRELILSLTAEKRHLETSLLGRGFSFSPGVRKGEADITVLRFSQELIQPQTDSVLAMRSVFSIGIDVLDATINESGPDGEFFVWTGQIQWARRMKTWWNSQLILRADMQIAANPLLPMEKFSMGGMGTGGVRGYRKNQLVKDNAVAGSAELRTPLIQLPLPYLSKGEHDGTLSIAPFFDIGWGEDIDNSNSETDVIYSLGLGLRWDISRKIHAYIYYGHGFEQVENISRNLQDEGIHFDVRCEFF
ncbi:ShlB/FhaC/HecB family hemolysin secretion/activation protein [Desulfococcaceae bacterium HSG9]|nr:ShlB/FhaC/HecB family hemolysin secretion/activation protein [Desulfococcaceae bacterium HSG9]